MTRRHAFWPAMASFVLGLAFASQASATPSRLDGRAPAPVVTATSGVQLAQAAPAATPSAPPDATTAPAAAAPAQPAAAPADAATPPPPEPIGSVAKLTGTATLIRDNQSYALSLQDDIYKNDTVQTGINSALDITFNDATTFSMISNSRMTIDDFVYAEGGNGNAALFDIAKGTVAFVAAAVAKTGDMKIATPTATLGIRGTSGVVEVPDARTGAAQRDVAIKLYPDADGKVGRIEINGRDGARLGLLSQGATGFAIRPGIGAGARFAAVPLVIPPQQVMRDRSIVQRVHVAQTVGRQIVDQRREARRNNPPGQPGLQRAPGARQPGQPPRPGSQQPGLQRPNGAPPPGQRQNNLQQQRPNNLQQGPATPQRPAGLPPGGPQPGGPQRLNSLPPPPGVQQRQGGTPVLQPRGPGQLRPVLPRAAGPLRAAPLRPVGPPPKHRPRTDLR